VVQKCIEVLRPADFQFFMNELMSDSPVQMALHKFGCRVVIRLLEHGLPGQVHDVAEALMPSTSILAQHAYGNYVLQSMMSYCAPGHRCRIMEALREEIDVMCKSHFGSSVVRAVLAVGSSSERMLLAASIMKSQGLMLHLAQSRRGHAIIKLVVKVLELPERSRLLTDLAIAEGLSASRYGRSVLQLIELNQFKKLPPNAVVCGA